MGTQYIYLLQEREFINSKQPIYKIGKTKQPNHKRFNSYPKGSVLLLQTECSNCDDYEKQILFVFDHNFKKRTDIGSEYFEGNYKMMMKYINNIIDSGDNFLVDNVVVENIQKYICNSCIKEYLNYKSVWSHNKKFHNGIENNKPEIFEEKPKTIEYGCRKCDKMYKHKQTRFTHEKTCTGIKQTNLDLEVEKTRLEVEKMKQDTLDKEENILELKIKLQSMEE